MRLGMNLGYFGAGAPSGFVPLVQRAEALGYHSVWTAEAYGSDALTPLIWAGAHTEKIHLGTGIMQMPARTPANTAMTAATIDMLSGGRFLLGLGLSGPQVVEGWHGEAYGKPLVKTREYVEIVREILKRERPLEHHGEHYDIPYTGEGATGLGKPLKLITHPLRADIPIYLASIGPKNVKLTADIADGWLPLFFAPTRWQDAFGDAFEGKDLSSFDIAPSVTVVLGDDVDACRSFVKPQLALYVGGMGARGKNFYNDLACRYGYEAEAKQIQDLYLDGKKQEATALVPAELVRATNLIGPESLVAERLAALKEAGVTTVNVTPLAPTHPERLALVAKLRELAG